MYCLSTLYCETVIICDEEIVEVWCLVVLVWYHILLDFESFFREKMY